MGLRVTSTISFGTSSALTKIAPRNILKVCVLRRSLLSIGILWSLPTDCPYIYCTVNESQYKINIQLALNKDDELIEISCMILIYLSTIDISCERHVYICLS